MSAITESARGEICELRLPGACSFSREQTVWAHANGISIGKGIGMKSPDILGAYACWRCHNVYDRREKPPFGMTYDDVELAFWHGHARSLVKLFEKGVVKI